MYLYLLGLLGIMIVAGILAAFVFYQLESIPEKTANDNDSGQLRD